MHSWLIVVMAKEKKKDSKKPEKKEIKKKEIKKEAPKSKAKEKTKLKEDIVPEDTGIIVVENDTEMDKEAELEARKAYLEEARSQEAAED